MNEWVGLPVREVRSHAACQRSPRLNATSPAVATSAKNPRGSPLPFHSPWNSAASLAVGAVTVWKNPASRAPAAGDVLGCNALTDYAR